MSLRDGVAALLLALAAMLTGCAGLLPTDKAAANATTQASDKQSSAAAAALPTDPAASQPAAVPSASNVSIQVKAPPPLRALLERYLDLVRLGRTTATDIDDSEWARLIDATPAQVRDLLQTEGYFSPEISLQRITAADGVRTEAVQLTVEPGLQARVGRVTLEVQGELATGAEANEPYAQGVLAKVRESFPLKEGVPFRNDSWASAKNSTLVALRAAGYANASWSGTGAGVDVASNTVRLFLVADSGPLYRLGTLDIEGLVRQDVQTVRNLALSERGAPVSESLLLDFQDRLQKVGLFDSVNVTLDTDPEQAAAATVRLRLREAAMQVYTAGIGFSANTGARASLEHVYRRVFGYAATSRNKFELGDRRRAWEGEIIAHPGPRLYRNLVGGAVEWLQTDSDTVLSQRLRVGRAQDTQRLERLFFLEAERSVRTPLGQPSTSAFALSGNFHGGWRDLDSVLLPTRGATLKVELGAGRAHGSDSQSGYFARTYGRVVGYLPLGDNWYGQARLELGQVFLPSGVVVPDSKRFRAGGDESIRGYSFRSLGPDVNGAVGGGLSLATASIEVARPILPSLPSVWGAVFLDAGNAADSFGKLKPVYGLGAGVRWRSPVGPLRLDMAYGTAVKAWRLHFSVGIAF